MGRIEIHSRWCLSAEAACHQTSPHPNRQHSDVAPASQKEKKNYNPNIHWAKHPTRQDGLLMWTHSKINKPLIKKTTLSATSSPTLIILSNYRERWRDSARWRERWEGNMRGACCQCLTDRQSCWAGITGRTQGWLARCAGVHI